MEPTEKKRTGKWKGRGNLNYYQINYFYASHRIQRISMLINIGYNLK